MVISHNNKCQLDWGHDWTDKNQKCCEESTMNTRKSDVVAELDTLKRLQAETTAELGALLPAILDKVFKGKL